MPNVHVPWYPTTICGTHIYLPSHERTDQILVRSSFFFKNVEVKNATINPQINVLIVVKILFTTLSGNALIHCNILSPPRINVFIQFFYHISFLAFHNDTVSFLCYEKSVSEKYGR